MIAETIAPTSAARKASALDAAASDLLSTSADKRSAPTLTALSVGGLVSLIDAYDTAAKAFIYEANTPRAEASKGACSLLDAAGEECHAKLDAVLEELRRRQPEDGWSRDARAQTLIRHAGDDWREVIDLASSALAAKEQQ